MEEKQTHQNLVNKKYRVLAWIGNAVLYWIALAFLIAGTQGEQNITPFVIVGLFALADGILFSIILPKIFKASRVVIENKKQ